MPQSTQVSNLGAIGTVQSDGVTITGNGSTGSKLMVLNGGIGPNNLNNVTRLTSDVNSINGTESTGIAWVLLANTNYQFDAYLYITQNTNLTDIQIHALASGAALVWLGGSSQAVGVFSVTVDKTADPAVGVSTDIFGGIGGPNPTVFFVQLHGLVTVGSTPTTLQIDSHGAGTGSFVKTGSYLEVSAVV